MRIRPIPAALAALAALALTGAGPCEKGVEPKPGERVTIKGRLTDEGVECRAMRGSDGRLYTLAGGAGTFKSGDDVCVTGTVAEMSICMQGITLDVQSIGPASECR